jgi:hypothetical protein
MDSCICLGAIYSCNSAADFYLMCLLVRHKAAECLKQYDDQVQCATAPEVVHRL